MRTLLESKGDVAIGAYAVRLRRRRAIIASFGLVLLLLSTWFFFRLSGTAPLSGRDRVPTELRCQACGHTRFDETGLRVEFPLTCDACKEPALRPCWICRECGKRFVNPPRSDYFECPQCRSMKIGSPVEPDHSVDP
ncbi:MAG: hypothetical protein AB7N71_03555 [Phycisphaerae bacterium]